MEKDVKLREWAIQVVLGFYQMLDTKAFSLEDVIRDAELLEKYVNK